MSLIVIFLLTVAAVGYVVYPLLFSAQEAQALLPALPVVPEAVLVDGVAYGSEDEWAVDQVLGKVGEAGPDLRGHQARTDLDARIEQRVAALRAEWREARAQSRRVLCPSCGKPFQAGDRFCARCGEPHPAVCPDCGERYRPGDRFCTRCGFSLPGGTE